MANAAGAGRIVRSGDPRAEHAVAGSLDRPRRQPYWPDARVAPGSRGRGGDAARRCARSFRSIPHAARSGGRNIVGALSDRRCRARWLCRVRRGRHVPRDGERRARACGHVRAEAGRCLSAAGRRAAQRPRPTAHRSSPRALQHPRSSRCIHSPAVSARLRLLHSRRRRYPSLPVHSRRRAGSARSRGVLRNFHLGKPHRSVGALRTSAGRVLSVHRDETSG